VVNAIEPVFRLPERWRASKQRSRIASWLHRRRFHNEGITLNLCLRRGIAAVAGCCIIVLGQAKAAQGAASDEWQSVRFLVGNWKAKIKGGSAGAASTGSYSFRPELRGHVLARHTFSSGCTGPADFDCQHSDLLYIYRDLPKRELKAIYLDSEGYVIHYDVRVPEPNTAVFSSESSAQSPEFRLIYVLKGKLMHGEFQRRMPGQSDFTSYLEWSGAEQLHHRGRKVPKQ
jgi:hypothetical protein